MMNSKDFDRIRWVVLKIAVVVLMALGLQAPNAAAQVVTATLTGQVSDASGAIILNAEVVITDLRTGVRQSIKTNSAGHYTVSYLQPSTYSVTISSAGFKEFRESPIILSAATVVRVDAKMLLGKGSEVVNVTADAGLLQTETGEVQQVIPKAFVQELPLPNRNYQNLVTLLPGTTPPAPTSTALQNPEGSITFYSDGRAPSSNISIVDGIYNSEPLIGVVVNIPSAEAIDEVHVESASYSAEFGGAGGAVVTSTSRSGSNGYHGSAYGFYQAAALKARNFFNVIGQPKGNLVYNQDGATFGGPIKHDKTFLFLSFLDSFQSKSTTTTATVAPNGWRTGNFTSVSGLTLYNPSSGNPSNGSGRTPYATSQLDPLTFNSVAKAILQYMPPSQGPDTLTSNNYTTNVPFSNRGTSYDARVDQYWSDRLKSFVKFNFSDFNIYNPGVLGPVIGDSEYSQFRTQTAVISTVYALTPSLLTNFVVGYNRYSTNVLPATNAPLNTNFGISDPSSNSLSNAGLAIISINGMTSMGESTTYPVQNTDNILDFINNWTKTVHTHTFKWGAEFRDLRLDRRQATGLGYGPRGTFAFNPGTTETNGGSQPASTAFAHSFAAFLLGATDTTSRTYLTATPTNRQKYFGVYAQDNWQVSNRLSLNLGLRWEVFTPITPSHPGGASNYDPATNNLLIAGVGNVGMSTGVQTDYKDFGPRIGAAYRISKKLVLRGGYAIGYYTGVSGYTGGTLSTQYPVVSNVLIGTANDYVVGGTFNALPTVTPVPIPASGIINPPPTQSFYSVPFHNPLPYDQSLNVTLQQELTPTTSVQYAFVATIARRIPNDVSINAAPPGTGNAGRSLYVFVGAQSITQRGYTSQEDYEGGQFSLNHRLSHGIQLVANYTWSKDREGANPPGSTARPHLYGLSTGDRTNIISVGHIIQLPFGHNQKYLNSGIGSKILGGFKFNGIFKKYSGTPFTVSADATSCNCPGNSQVADQVKPVTYLHGIGTGHPWFDTTAFAAPAANRYGNSDTGSVRGPGFTDYDFSVLREFTILDRYKVEARGTAYNLTNTPEFGNPGATFGSSSFGIISSTLNSVGERQLEFGLRLLF